MAADGPNGDGGDEFDPRSTELECTEEHIDSDLKAPDEKLWYHGRLDRQSAEDCLRSSGKVGSYLIRESDNKPGSFVLSYLGQSGPPTHFRIIAMCGDYYIGGRQFESLSDLIGYYTACSCLSKNEQLKFPVAPKEPVHQRRVLAVLSYRRFPETDELNFDKGDTFIVQNELENEWLWVTHERTKESGLVPTHLMEELTCDGDPVEALPYFHGNISKEEAVEKLNKAGDGSYLVRPSENSPGDYSLFFLRGKEVLRFRIEKKNRFLHLGGRYFESLNNIVERYTSEEIVEGSKLKSPVPRIRNLDKINGRFEPVDAMEEIYSSIRQSSGPSLLTRSNDRIDITGFLNKRSDRKKMWKSFFFVLNGTEKYLYYFENEKKSKPKGFIDLSYSALYPVHDSLFGRANCFQIASKYDNNNEQFCYVSAENADLAQRWIQNLKPYCEQSCMKSHHSLLKEFHKLEVSILNAHRLSPKFLNHPYCVLTLNSVHMNNVRFGRTEVGDGNNPFWNADFFLDDIPPNVVSFTILLYNKTRLKDEEKASVTIQLSELSGKGFQENTCPLQPLPAIRGDLGSIRIKTRYEHEIIMPHEEYTSLKELLLDEGFEHILTLAQVSEESERTTLAHALLQIFRYERKEASLLCSLNEKEIEKEVDVPTLFRAGSLATTLMVQYMKMSSSNFVHRALREPVQKIVELKQSCELDPKLLENTTDQQPNSEVFLKIITEMVESIFNSIESCPMTLRYVCNCLQKRAKTKWPLDETVRTRVVSGFIFLRLLCPAIINPKSFNLVSENPSETASRTLVLGAKVLQNLANLVDVGPKETYMEVIQPFIRQHRSKMILYLDDLSNVSKEPLVTDMLSGDPARELATIHQLCANHLDSLKSYVSSQASTKKIVVVTEMLTNHMKRYMENT